MTEPRRYIHMVALVGDVESGHSLDDVVADLGRRAHEDSESLYGPNAECTFHAFAREVVGEGGVVGTWVEFEEMLTELQAPDDARAVYMALAARCQRPVAVVHIQPGDPVYLH